MARVFESYLEYSGDSVFRIPGQNSNILWVTCLIRIKTGRYNSAFPALMNVTEKQVPEY